MDPFCVHATVYGRTNTKHFRGDDFFPKMRCDRRLPRGGYTPLFFLTSVSHATCREVERTPAPRRQLMPPPHTHLHGADKHCLSCIHHPLSPNMPATPQPKMHSKAQAAAEETPPGPSADLVQDFRKIGITESHLHLWASRGASGSARDEPLLSPVVLREAALKRRGWGKGEAEEANPRSVAVALVVMVIVPNERNKSRFVTFCKLA